MQPYQEASEEIRRQGEMPLKGLKAAGSIAATALGGSAALKLGSTLSRILPFLNEYIPEELAKKGLSKIDPRFGSFINKSLEAGKTWPEISDFIKEKVESDQPSKKSQPQQNENPIKQYSGELHAFVEDLIQKGRSPLEAGAIAQLNPKFSKIITKMSKDFKSPWSAILSTVYGQGQPQQGQQETQAPQGQMGQQGQNSGRGDEALLAALDKILKM